MVEAPVGPGATTPPALPPVLFGIGATVPVAAGPVPMVPLPMVPGAVVGAAAAARPREGRRRVR